jgi:hypothetical protein
MAFTVTMRPLYLTLPDRLFLEVALALADPIELPEFIATTPEFMVAVVPFVGEFRSIVDIPFYISVAMCCDELLCYLRGKGAVAARKRCE